MLGKAVPWVLLPELECETPELVHWAPLRDLARRIAAVDPPLSTPPPEVLEKAVRLVEDNEENEAHLGAFWQQRGGAWSSGGEFPFERYCILGHFTALYIMAWARASPEHGGQLHSAANMLRGANWLLRLDDHDLLA